MIVTLPCLVSQIFDNVMTLSNIKCKLVSGFWTFNYSTSSVLTNFVATTNTPSSIIITWGDNSTDTVNSDINISHNYTI